MQEGVAQRVRTGHCTWGVMLNGGVLEHLELEYWNWSKDI